MSSDSSRSLGQYGRQTRRRPPDYGVKREPGDAPQLQGASYEEELEGLKAFDLDYSFGPCYGITRLERWHRAKKLGLNPPDSVKQLIEQHPREPTYTESLWTRRMESAAN